MSTVLIEPRDTLVLGDGRRIGEATANRSIDLPWPSTFAGTLRTEAGLDPKTRRFNASPDDARQWAVRGPLLTELGADGEPQDVLFPVPKDAVYFDGEGVVTLRALRVLPDAATRGLTDLPDDLALVGLPGAPELRKPWSKAPRYWSRAVVERWLLSPTDQPWTDPTKVTIGRDRRTSVALDDSTRTVKTGALFEVEHAVYADGVGASARRFALLGAFDKPLGARVVCLGGERRLSFLRSTSNKLPEPPAGLVAAIATNRRARLVLATPAIFDEGYRPRPVPGAKVYAAAVDRPQVISGWDWKTKQPKAARRCAPAGSVYWVELDATTDPETWVRDRWLQNLSSDPQDQLDGFGLTLVGAAP